MKYRDDLEDENEVTWLDSEEFLISDIFLLSLESGISSVSCNYTVVKDYCKIEKLSVIDVYKVCKTMAAEFADKD